MACHVSELILLKRILRFLHQNHQSSNKNQEILVVPETILLLCMPVSQKQIKFLVNYLTHYLHCLCTCFCNAFRSSLAFFLFALRCLRLLPLRFRDRGIYTCASLMPCDCNNCGCLMRSNKFNSAANVTEKSPFTQIKIITNKHTLQVNDTYNL